MFKSLLLLSLILVSSLYSQETHVFWYKALQNNYALSDSPGPDIPAGAIVHEGKMATCNYAVGLGFGGNGFSCGSNANDDQGWSSCLYSANLNDPNLTGRVDSAFIRGEYLDLSTFGGPLCYSGPIDIRCGVVDLTFSVDTLFGGGDNVPEDAVWADLSPLNTLNYSLSLVDSTIDTLAFISEAGRTASNVPPLLDSHFVRVDVTKQVQWIIQYHNGEYGIALLSNVGQGSTGIFSLRATETCIPDTFLTYGMVPNQPWSKDDNTVHLLVYGDLTDNINSEKALIKTGQECVISICPNPLNPTTTISYDISGNGQAKLAIFSLAGKLVYQKQVSGKGSYTWDASAQPSGVYVCKVNAGRKTFAKKMILIR